MVSRRPCSQGATVVLGPDEYFPLELRLVAGRAFWISHGIGVPDTVRSNDLTGTSLTPIFVEAEELTGLAACGTTLYTGGNGVTGGVWRWAVGETNPLQVAGSQTYGVACMGDNVYASVRDNRFANGTNNWEVGVDRIGANGVASPFVRLPAGPDGPLQVARTIVATPSFVYWQQTDDQLNAGAVQRVMRMPI